MNSRVFCKVSSRTPPIKQCNVTVTSQCRHTVTLRPLVWRHVTWMWSYCDVNVETLLPFFSLSMTTRCGPFVKSPCDFNKENLPFVTILHQITGFYSKPFHIVRVDFFFSLQVCDICDDSESGRVTRFYENPIRKDGAGTFFWVTSVCNLWRFTTRSLRPTTKWRQVLNNSSLNAVFFNTDRHFAVSCKLWVASLSLVYFFVKD